MKRKMNVVRGSDSVISPLCLAYPDSSLLPAIDRSVGINKRKIDESDDYA